MRQSHCGGVVCWLALLASVALAGSTRADDTADLRRALLRGQEFSGQSKFPEAAREFEKALKLLIKGVGEKHQATAEVLQVLGFTYAQIENYPVAESYYQRAVDAFGATRGVNDTRTADCLQGLASAYFSQEQFPKAEAAYRRALKIRQTKQGRNHADTLACLASVGETLTALGQLEKAEEVLLQADAGFKAGPANQKVQHAGVYSSLADVYRRMEKHELALQYATLAVVINEVEHGKDHPATGGALEVAGNVLQFSNRAAQSIPIYERAVAIFEASYGREHMRTASAMNGLALAHHKLGNYDKADPLYRASLATSEAKFGKDHVDSDIQRNNLAILLAAKEDYAASAKTYDAVRRIQRRQHAQILPALSEKDQLRFLKVDEERMIRSALSLGLQRRADQDTTRLSATWVLNGKAVALQALVERALQSRDSRNPKAAEIVEELKDVRSKLANLALGKKADAEAHDDLADKERELSKQLAKLGGTASTEIWVELANVRRAIPAGAVLIEVMKFPVIDFKSTDDKTRWSPARYVAWVIPREGDISIVDLGLAQEIENEVQSLRKELIGAVKLIVAKGEPEAEQQLHTALKAVSEKVLAPLLPKVKAFNQWIISPDASLWLLPWEILLDADKYAVEIRSIRYVVTGRDLADGPARVAVEAKSPLMLADPDYDLDRTQAATALKRIVPDAPERGRRRSASRSLALGKVGRLPGTAAEAELVKPRLQDYAGETPRLFTGRRALEGVFKATKNPRIVVLSTHGFFLEDQAVAADGPSKDQILENPLVRCGLLLAGCNDVDNKKAGQDDGVLTGLEIVGVDLRGCELVVLSACETGLGDVRNGEGVAGLRQAFQLAGAEAVVASLWQVPDRDTAILMVRFFEQLAGGKSKAEALRAARLSLIEARRRRNGAAHPFFWAAFTLTGHGS